MSESPARVAVQALTMLPEHGDAALPVYQLPADWHAVEFISDIHLSADRPRTAAVFFDLLDGSKADAVCLLGDLFDVWVGDDILDLGGFERSCVERLLAANQQRPLYFLPGNRDFLVGARFYAESGCQPLPDPCVLEGWGQRVLLTHGDAWCLADADYQRFRHQVRSPLWQQQVLERPLAERQALGKQIRTASDQHKTARGLAGYADVDANHASQWLARAHAHVLIHGHTHQPTSEPFGSPTSVRHVLSDWEADEGPARGDLLRWTPLGIDRQTLPAPAADGAA